MGSPNKGVCQVRDSQCIFHTPLRGCKPTPLNVAAEVSAAASTDSHDFPLPPTTVPTRLKEREFPHEASELHVNRDQLVDWYHAFGPWSLTGNLSPKSTLPNTAGYVVRGLQAQACIRVGLGLAGLRMLTREFGEAPQKLP